MDPADAEVARALAAGNAAYEERVSTGCSSSGRPGAPRPEILAELDRRLDNDDDAEREETVTQLREIALLRLRQVAS